MTSPLFAKTVTFICTYNPEGAMGIIINRSTNLTYKSLLGKIKVELLNTAVAHDAVLYDSVQPERGFILHDATADEWDLTMAVAANIKLTTSAATLHKILYVLDCDAKLAATMDLLGIDPTMLSDVAGHA